MPGFQLHDPLLPIDALRTMARFGLTPEVHFVEGSTALRALQREAVPQAQFHDDLGTLPADAPLLLVGNEFLDALPVRQLVKAASGWRERMVDWAEDRFRPVAGDKPMDAAVPEEWQDAAEGAILETAKYVREAHSGSPPGGRRASLRAWTSEWTRLVPRRSTSARGRREA